MVTLIEADGFFSEECLCWRLNWHITHWDNANFLARLPTLNLIDAYDFRCEANFSESGGRTIDISTAAVNSIALYFQHAFASANTLGFTQFESPATEKPPKCKTVRDLTSYLLNMEDPLPPREPIERWAAAYAMASTAIDYLILHELAHHVLGHLEAEVAKEIKTDAERHSLELEADLFAALTLHRLFAEDPDYHVIREFDHVSKYAEKTFGKGMSRRYLAMVSVSSLFALWREGDWPDLQHELKKYPPDMVRCYGILGAIAGYPKLEDPLVGIMIDTAIKESWVTMIQMVDGIPAPEAPDEAMSQLLQEYMDKIEVHYDRVRDILYSRD